MNTLILLIENECSWSPLVWAIENGGESMEDGRVVIDDMQGSLSLLADSTVLDDFDDDERAQALATLVAPSSFIVEWCSDRLIEAFVAAVPKDSRVFVDNDRGVFASVTLLQNTPLAAWARAATRD